MCQYGTEVKTKGPQKGALTVKSVAKADDSSRSAANSSLAEEFLHSQRFMRAVARNNAITSIAISSMLALVGLIGLVSSNTYLSHASAFSVVSPSLVYILLMVVNLPYLYAGITLRTALGRSRVSPRLALNVNYAFLLANAFLSGMTIYSTQTGSSYFLEMVVVMTLISILPYLRLWRGISIVAVSAFTSAVILLSPKNGIALQDFYDVSIFYAICISCMILRRRWFDRSALLSERLRRTSRTDELTGLYNRAALRDDFSLFATPDVCISMIDIDDFKTLNDQYGHLYGDKVIAQLGAYIRQNFKDKDARCYRYGGDEFLLITQKLPAEVLQDRLLQLQRTYRDSILTDCPIGDQLASGRGNAGASQDKETPHTLSIGFCFGDLQNEHDVRSCLRTADDCLYTAKSSGKSRLIGR